MSVESQRPVGVATTSSYLPELESLRGWAILLVVMFHVDGFMLGAWRRDTMLDTTSPLLAFVRGGNSGVNLFFALSGFLLALPFFAAARRGRAVPLRRFAARRALRILPLYYAAVIATGTMFVFYGVSILRILPYFVFLNALPGVTEPLMPYSLTWWSLATEVQFYLLLPLLGVGLRRRWLGILLLAGFASVYAAFIAGWFPTGGRGQVQAVGVSVIGRGPLFLAGIAAAWVYDRYGERLRTGLARAAWARYGGADLALVSVLLAIGMLLAWALRTGLLRIQQPPLHAWHVPQALLWGTVLLLLLVAPLRLKPLVVNPVLERLGLLSYSLYLVHVPVLVRGLGYLRNANIIAPGWSLRGAFAVVGLAVLCVVISALTYRYIERPFLVRKERYGERAIAADTATPLQSQSA